MDRVVELYDCRFFNAFGRRLSKEQLRSHPIATVVAKAGNKPICETIRLEGNKYILYTPSNEEIECKIVSTAEEPIVSGVAMSEFSFSLADYKGEKLYDYPTLIWMKISGIDGNLTMCGEVNSEYKEFKVHFSEINELGFKSGSNFYTL